MNVPKFTYDATKKGAFIMATTRFELLNAMSQSLTTELPNKRTFQQVSRVRPHG